MPTRLLMRIARLVRSRRSLGVAQVAEVGATETTHDAPRYTSPSLMAVLTLPLAPFTALDGVDSGAEAIRDFNATARPFSRIMAQMPAQIRAEIRAAALRRRRPRDGHPECRRDPRRWRRARSASSESIERLPADLQQIARRLPRRDPGSQPRRCSRARDLMRPARPR